MAKQYIKPMQLRHELARRVLAVANPQMHNPERWTAYIDAVPGENHDREENAVLETGLKLQKHIACVLFPQFDPRHFAK